MEHILKTTGLKKYYGEGETMVRALDGVDLAIERGSFTAIIGTSGSGKSTLLNMLGGLDTPTEGSVKIGSTELSLLSEEQATVFRRKQIGFVFQNYNLIPILTVWENIIFPISLDGQKPDKKYIMDIVKMLGLENRLDCLPNNLSGGQQQRVAIARTLALQPDIVLLDEPISALDVTNREIMKTELKTIQKKFDSTMIFITHEQEEAFYLSDRIMIMSEGNIEQIDTPANIYSHPANQYIKDFVIAHLEQKYESLLKCTGRAGHEK